MKGHMLNHAIDSLISAYITFNQLPSRISIGGRNQQMLDLTLT